MAATGTGAELDVLAIPYGVIAGIYGVFGGFSERFAQGAFQAQFADGFTQIPVVADEQHSDEELVASTVNGSMVLTDTPAGVMARMQLLPDDTRLVNAIDSGLYPGASIVFTADANQWSELPDGTSLRTVTAATLWAVSIVGVPAYQTTSVRVTRRSVGSPTEAETAALLEAGLARCDRIMREDADRELGERQALEVRLGLIDRQTRWHDLDVEIARARRSR